MPLYGRQKYLRLLFCKRLYIKAFLGRRSDAITHILSDQPPLYRRVQSVVENAVIVVDGRRGEALILFLRVELLHMLSRQLLQLVATERRDDMQIDNLAIALKSTWA